MLERCARAVMLNKLADATAASFLKGFTAQHAHAWQIPYVRRLALPKNQRKEKARHTALQSTPA